MKLYAFRIYELGSIVATDTEISKTAIIKRTREQRYQIPSLLRAAKENNLDPEVIDAITYTNNLRSCEFEANKLYPE